MMIDDDDDDNITLVLTQQSFVCLHLFYCPPTAVAFFLQAVVNVDRDAGGSTWDAIVY